MTPQPSALAALQRQFRDILNSAQESYGVGLTVELSKDDYEVLRKLAEQWRTQAQGESWMMELAHEIKTNAEDHPNDYIAKFAMQWAFKLYARATTDPSPSTAALREALRECAELLESIYKGGPKSWVAERARTLLAGDSRAND